MAILQCPIAIAYQDTHKQFQFFILLKRLTEGNKAATGNCSLSCFIYFHLPLSAFFISMLSSCSLCSCLSFCQHRGYLQAQWASSLACCCHNLTAALAVPAEKNWFFILKITRSLYFHPVQPFLSVGIMAYHIVCGSLSGSGCKWFTRTEVLISVFFHTYSIWF